VLIRYRALFCFVGLPSPAATKSRMSQLIIRRPLKSFGYRAGRFAAFISPSRMSIDRDFKKLWKFAMPRFTSGIETASRKNPFWPDLKTGSSATLGMAGRNFRIGAKRLPGYLMGTRHSER
jgi:hypothetical protein